MCHGSPNIVKTGRLDFSLSWLKGESGRLPKIDQNFNVSFPTTACPPTFHKTSVVHNDLKKDAINEFGIKYWTSNPVWVKFQEHGSSFYVNIEEKVWLLVNKIDLKRLTGRLKLRFLTEIGWFHWNRGEKVVHFAWFGDPCACLVEKYQLYSLWFHKFDDHEARWTKNKQ
jgi:hypothetical protein